MNYSKQKMAELADIVNRHASTVASVEESVSAVSSLYLFKGVTCQTAKTPVIYDSGIILLVQGKKVAFLNDQVYDFSPGHYVSIFLPMALQTKVIEASLDNPLLMMGIQFDMSRVATLMMKFDKQSPITPKINGAQVSGIMQNDLSEELLDAILRLTRLLDKPMDRAVLTDIIMDEIYYRVISNDTSGTLRYLLQHRGQIPEISRTVDHIHKNLDQVISVNDLANMVNMSPSSFRKAFREIMHLPPLQYAKSVKLNRAQLFIRQGKNASEAGYLVGYNSPAQFSREYKRHFGYAPSQTIA